MASFASVCIYFYTHQYIVEIMNALTFRLLEVFKQIVESGSITAASVALQLSQPTVSLQLKKLTEICGMTLLETHHGTVRLTDAGSAVYQCANDIIRTRQHLSSQLDTLKMDNSRGFKLAVVTTAKYLIPPILKPFCLENPDINVQLKVGNTEQITQRLQDNKDDLYIFSEVPEMHNITATAFMDNHLTVIAPADYTGPNHCHLKDLQEQKFLIREAGSATHQVLVNYCEQHNIKLSNIMLIESNEAIHLAVASGLGVAVLSQHTLKQSKSGAVKELNIIDFPIINQWHTVTLKHRPQSGSSEKFQYHLANYDHLASAF